MTDKKGSIDALMLSGVILLASLAAITAVASSNSVPAAYAALTNATQLYAEGGSESGIAKVAEAEGGIGKTADAGAEGGLTKVAMRAEITKTA